LFVLAYIVFLVGSVPVEVRRPLARLEAIGILGVLAGIALYFAKPIVAGPLMALAFILFLVGRFF
jgi:hypothetical protein